MQCVQLLVSEFEVPCSSYSKPCIAHILLAWLAWGCERGSTRQPKVRSCEHHMCGYLTGQLLFAHAEACNVVTATGAAGFPSTMHVAEWLPRLRAGLRDLQMHEGSFLGLIITCCPPTKAGVPTAILETFGIVLGF